MKRILLLIILLSACSSEPIDMKKATCVAGDTFEYHYSENKVYNFFVNGIEQDDGMVSIVQGSVDDFDLAVDYFESAFQHGTCVFTDIPDE